MRELFLLIVLFTAFQSFSQKDIFQIARNGSGEEIKLYLKSNPKALNSVDVKGSTPLILACYYNNIDVVKELVRQGADVNSKIDMGSALMAAVVKGNVEIVLYLLENGADPNLRDANQSTALLYATLFKNVNIVSILIKFKADKNLKDARELTALDYAKQFNHDELIQILK